VLNLILVHICILYLKPKANFLMEMSLSNKPSNVDITLSVSRTRSCEVMSETFSATQLSRGI